MTTTNYGIEMHTTKSGEKIPVFGMTADHLSNEIIRYCEYGTRGTSYIDNEEDMKYLEPYIVAMMARSLEQGNLSLLRSSRACVMSRIGRMGKADDRTAILDHAHMETSAIIDKIVYVIEDLPSMCSPLTVSGVFCGELSVEVFMESVKDFRYAMDKLSECYYEIFVRGDFRHPIVEESLGFLFGRRGFEKNRLSRCKNI